MKIERAINPNTFIHPRQTYLWNRLHSDSLPEGAAELIADAIEEYQSAFGNSQRRANDRKIFETQFTAQLPEDSPGTILAGRSHLLTVRFEREGQTAEEISELHTHLAVMLRLRNMPGTEIYPDWLRYVSVDIAGKSRPTPFLLVLPNSLQGYRGIAELGVLNGGTLVVNQPLDIRIA